MYLGDVGYLLYSIRLLRGLGTRHNRFLLLHGGVLPILTLLIGQIGLHELLLLLLILILALVLLPLLFNRGRRLNHQIIDLWILYLLV